LLNKMQKQNPHFVMPRGMRSIPEKE